MLMEEMILKIIEQNLIGGAFVFLLYQFVTKFSKSQEKIVETLSEISSTLETMDERIKALEEKE